MKRTQPSNFANALRTIRRARGISQEEFDEVSGRTYVSQLERGLKSPTLQKIEDLAKVLGVHPLTLLTMCFTASGSSTDIERLHARVSAELVGIQRAAQGTSS